MRRSFLLVVLTCVAVPALVAQQAGTAFVIVNLPRGDVIASSRPDLIDTPVRPGSLAKIAALAAALESSVITEGTAIQCPRTVKVAGHSMTCSHPDLHRPLRPVDALAHSCNGFFATIAARLPRAALDDALSRLGLPKSDPQQPVAAVALGIEGIRASPRRLMDMLVKVSAEPSALRWKPETLRVIRDGLRGAAQYGTASALQAHGIEALAKTGTTIGSSGRAQGLVAGVTPASKPSRAFVMLTSGAAGADAAELAAEQLERAPTAGSTSPALRIGVAGTDRRYTVRELPLEDYVAGVVAGEAADSRPAALEALAITVRTFALANRGRHADDGFDLCDLTHCQVLRPSTAATRAAAAATAGRVLLDNGKPASVYYSASCGGTTERPSAVWRNAADVPFLPSRRDDAHEGEAEWSADITAASLLQMLRAGGFRGDRLLNLRVVERNTSGRVAWLELEGMTPDRISGPDFRTLTGRALGWQHVKSTLFEVQRRGAGYTFTGRGFGHGVGLCELGAARRAARGESATAILAAYFPGLRIAPATAAAKNLQVIVPESDQRDRDVIEAMAARARDQLQQQLGVVAPDRLILRFHPTVESYQRATGRPWFTSGATVGSEMHFLPPSGLRRRGILERTIRHELVHVLTAKALAGRPRWLIEGAAEYFSDERATVPPSGPTPAEVMCPADREFTSPSSAETLSAAYTRARTCFVRRLHAGANWAAP